jgi:hypothetical protein
MAELEEYRDKVQQLLTKYSQYKSSYGEVEVELIFDIKNEKIWIQENTTEVDIATELLEMGIPKQNIVMGFHTPKMRQLTGFAIG